MKDPIVFSAMLATAIMGLCCLIAAMIPSVACGEALRLATCGVLIIATAIAVAMTESKNQEG